VPCGRRRFRSDLAPDRRHAGELRRIPRHSRRRTAVARALVRPAAGAVRRASARAVDRTLQSPYSLRRLNCPNPVPRADVRRALSGARMPHSTPLIATLVAAFVLAFVAGMIAQRVRLSPIVGYLLAGVAVGPFTPGFVADQTLAPEL